MPDSRTPESPAGAPAGQPAPLYVIGLGLPAGGGESSARRGFFSCPALDSHPLLAAAEVLVGGKAQLAALADHPAEKLVVGADMPALYERLDANRRAGRIQVVLCNGDPLFFGLGARLAERFGPDGLRVLPGTSSLQAAAAFLGLPWENVTSVSLHGRSSRLPLARALIVARADGGPVFVLTDAANPPAAVAAFMKERGHDRYRLHLMENLHLTPEGVRAEQYTRLSVDQALALPPEAPEGRIPRQLVMLLEPERPESGAPAAGWPFGLPDASLVAENNLLTKAPARAAGLAALGIEAGHTVWDLGAGSGAVSVEAARLAWRGLVVAVEAKADRIPLIEENRRRFGAANLEILHGTLPGALAVCCERFPRPDRIFIGGGLGAVSKYVFCPMAASSGPFYSGRGPSESTPFAKRPAFLALGPKSVIWKQPLGGGPGRGFEDGSNGESAAGQILHKAWEALLPGGRLVIHCVLLSTLEFARDRLARLGARPDVACIQASLSTPLAGDCRLQAQNPVFLVSACKGAGM